MKPTARRRYVIAVVAVPIKPEAIGTIAAKSVTGRIAGAVPVMDRDQPHGGVVAVATGLGDTLAKIEDRAAAKLRRVFEDIEAREYAPPPAPAGDPGPGR